MSKYLKNRSRKAGMSPGTLLRSSEIRTEEIKISVIDYDKDKIAESENATIEECLIFLDTPSITWINIQGVHDPKMIEALGKHFKLHPLMMEDIITTGQRSKLDDYKTTIFIVAHMLTFNEKSNSKNSIVDEQVSIVLGPNYVISFLESHHDIFNPIRERIHNEHSRLRTSGADYLCYALIDSIVDNYFVILEKFDDKLVALEDELETRPTPKTLHNMQVTKRDIILLRKAVWPMREVISQFRRLECPLVKDETKVYMHDVYDHTIQAIDTIESFRDISAGMLDVYLSIISQRMNEIMKVLTVVSTIFVPLTFIASLYGMNLEYIPELHWKWMYPTVLGLMLTLVGGMLYFFKRKHWI